MDRVLGRFADLLISALFVCRFVCSVHGFLVHIRAYTGVSESMRGGKTSENMRGMQVFKSARGRKVSRCVRRGKVSKGLRAYSVWGRPVSKRIKGDSHKGMAESRTDVGWRERVEPAICIWKKRKNVGVEGRA